MGSLIDSTSSIDPGPAGDGYFSDEEARIVNNMVFGISSADDGGEKIAAAADGGSVDSGGGDDGNMEYLDGDLSTQFGRDHPHHGGQDRFFGQQQQQQQGLLTAGTGVAGAAVGSSPSKDQRQRRRRRRPRLLLLARLRLALRRSILRTSKAVPTMRFPQLVACGMVFACRAATANPWFGAASFVGAR